MNIIKPRQKVVQIRKICIALINCVKIITISAHFNRRKLSKAQFSQVSPFSPNFIDANKFRAFDFFLFGPPS